MSLVLITGSCGLVGAESVRFFSDKGFDVIGIDNNQRKFFFGKDGYVNWVKKDLIKNNKNYSHYDVDIRNYYKLDKIFKKYKKKINLIIHSAAQPSHDWAIKKPFVDFEINAKGTLNLLELTKIYSPSSPFIFMSTNKVYGDNPNKLPLTEKKTRWEIDTKHLFFNGITEKMSIDKAVHSFFGVSKSYADLIVQEYGKNIGLKTVCFRAGCITGPLHSGAKLHGFLSFLVKTIIKNKKYNLIGYKGKQVRDNIHSTDLVNCFWQYFKRPSKGEFYNVGGGRKSNCSILEAIYYIENKTGVEVNKTYSKTSRVGDHIWYISNMKKFKRDYPNWKQKFSTKNILDELIDK